LRKGPLAIDFLEFERMEDPFDWKDVATNVQKFGTKFFSEVHTHV
jgi:hypothetical protein